MRIQQVLFAPGSSAFFYDDQSAITRGARHDGFVYAASPVTPGFTGVRMAGESISVLLVLEDGQVAVGDCVAVQYSGAGGRDGVFLAQAYLPVLEQQIRPRLAGRELGPLRPLADEICGLRVDGRLLHTAIRSGVTQALLDARAKACHLLRSEVICQEYGLPVRADPIPIFGQSGDNRYEQVDKMILKQVDVLPHGLINNVEEKLGRDGGKLREYLRWLVARIARLKPRDDYCPVLHLDVYGTVGQIFDNQPRRVADYLARLEADAGPHALYVEGPVDMGGRSAQIETLREIRECLERSGSAVRTVADEWCNTYEDVVAFTDAAACHMVQIKTPDLGGVQEIVQSVLYCRAHGMEAYQGGTCNETDLSARCCVHLAMATRPARMLAKPGMGFDEGFMIVRNEMQRIGAVLAYRAGGPHGAA